MVPFVSHSISFSGHTHTNTQRHTQRQREKREIIARVFLRSCIHLLFSISLVMCRVKKDCNTRTYKNILHTHTHTHSRMRAHIHSDSIICYSPLFVILQRQSIKFWEVWPPPWSPSFISLKFLPIVYRNLLCIADTLYNCQRLWRYAWHSYRSLDMTRPFKDFWFCSSLYCLAKPGV